MEGKEIENLILKRGWFFIRQNGSHKIYKHPEIVGIVIIPFHGSKDIPKGTEQSILKKSQIK